MNARPNYYNYLAEIFTKYYNVIKHDSPKYIFRSVAYRLTAVLKHLRLKLIPFAHVNFSLEYNILCENVFGSSKKKIKSLPSLSQFLWL